jgi:hypothetical protein
MPALAPVKQLPDLQAHYERWVVKQMLSRRHVKVTWNEGRVILEGDGVTRDREKNKHLHGCTATAKKVFPTNERLRNTLKLLGFSIKGGHFVGANCRKYWQQEIHYNSEYVGSFFLWY